MKFFLIECDKNGVPSNDLGFAVIEAINFHNWFRSGVSDREYDWIQIKDMDFSQYLNDNFIPVGNIEFMEKFFHEFKNIHPRAINIPKELHKKEYLERNIETVKIGNIDRTISLGSNKFVKNALKIKGASGITDSIDQYFLLGERENYIDTERYYKEFLVSDIIDISSEWRCFVHNGKLLDAKQYSGDLFIVPDINVINSMISDYSSSPGAYTLDVAVTKDGKTVLIECHNFWSVGLYGFNCGDKLLNMVYSAFKWELKH